MWTFCDTSTNYHDGMHFVVRFGAVDRLLSLSVAGAALCHSVFYNATTGGGTVRCFPLYTTYIVINKF